MNLAANSSRTEVDLQYLQEAFAERANSDDPKARHVPQSGVGSIIVGSSGIIARSANVVPPNLRADLHSKHLAITEEDRYHFIEHAERAAIFQALQSGQLLDGATMYCTRFPCSDCARAIVWAGIGRVVLAAGYGGEAKWLEAQRAALRILRQSGVVVRIIKSAPACLDRPTTRFG